MAHRIILIGLTAGVPGQVRIAESALPAPDDEHEAQRLLEGLTLAGRWQTAELWSGSNADGSWVDDTRIASKP